MRTLLSLLIVLVVGCDVPMVVADRPFVEPGDEKIMPDLVGVWGATDGSVRVKIAATDEQMTVAFSAVGGDFGDADPVALTKIRRQVYAQLPADSPKGDGTQSWYPLRLTVEDADDITVEQLCSAWFKGQSPESAGLRFTVLDRQDDKADPCMSGSVLLQASTPELRRWLRKHRSTDGLFGLVAHLRREASTP